MAERINSFRDLRVWQIGMDVVKMTYDLTREFPASETYGLASQMQRSAISVPSNIAEGHTRQHRKEFLNHLSIAQASLAELDTQLEIALRLEYLSDSQVMGTREQVDSLGKQLRSLRGALSKRP